MEDQPNTYIIEDPNETPQEFLTRLSEVTGQRNGFGRAIELVLPDLCMFIMDNWTKLINEDFKKQWLKQFENHTIFLKEIPDISGIIPNTNIQNQTETTPDSPSIINRNSIRYNITRIDNAGFNRKMFSNNKQLKPKFRFNIARKTVNDSYEIIKVLTKTNEEYIEWDIYGRNTAEADFLYKCIEYIIYTKGRIFLEFGFQRFIALGQPRSISKDKSSKMIKKTLLTYARTEEYFYEYPFTTNISETEFSWDDFKIN